MAASDRRDNTRAQVLLKVQYQEPEDLLSDYLTDMAEGGLFIRTSVPFAVGQSIAFNISFPGLLDPLDLHGVVRWRTEVSEKNPEEPAGVGIEFIFASETARQHVAQLVASFRQDTNTPITAAPEPFRVLLVEDNQFVHDLFKHAVRRFHREMSDMGELGISSASNGQQALLFLEDHTIDLAIVDHFLPIMAGSELVTRMRSDPRYQSIPILVVSVGGEGVREQALRAGADLYLDKPVLMKQLLTTLRLLVTKRRFIANIIGA